MQILLNTDNHILGDQRLTEHTEACVQDAIGRFENHITRVEVHLQDVNSQKGGDDKRCMMEARLEGLAPVAVTHEAESILLALDGAAEKLRHALDNTFGKLNSRH